MKRSDRGGDGSGWFDRSDVENSASRHVCGNSRHSRAYRLVVGEQSLNVASTCCRQSPSPSKQGKGPRSEPGVHSMLRICVALLARQFPVYFAIGYAWDASASALLGNGQRERQRREGGLSRPRNYRPSGCLNYLSFGLYHARVRKRPVTRSPNNLALSHVAPALAAATIEPMVANCEMLFAEPLPS